MVSTGVAVSIPVITTPRPLTKFLGRIDAIYRDRPFFEGVRARLLVGFILLLFVYVPVNMVLMLWMRPQFYQTRIIGNVVMELCAIASLWLLLRGRLALAGGLVALAPLLPAHLGALISVAHIHPLSYGAFTSLQPSSPRRTLRLNSNGA